jgi:hypothetical protein
MPGISEQRRGRPATAEAEGVPRLRASAACDSPPAAAGNSLDAIARGGSRAATGLSR